MSADSPRRSSGSSRSLNMPAVVPPQVVSDRSILDSAIGFINDVTLVHQPHTDPKDTITWARFEQVADISDPRFGDDWELEGNVAPPLLLILGYGLGVQVWAIPANGEAVEVLSWRHGIVSALRILPTPGAGHAGAIDESHSRADEPVDAFAERRPLMALVDGGTATGAQPQFCAVNFVSLKTGTQVKTIKFKNPVLDVLANRSSIVITFHERIAVFDALTLEDRLSITTCFPSPGINPNPVALGPRWLAYAEHKLIHSKRSSAGCDGEGVASYTATMLNAAKSLGKGLRELGEQVAAGLTGTAGSAGSSKSGSFESGYGPDAKQPGIVTILDIKNPIKDYSPTSGAPMSGGQTAGSDPIVAHFIAHSEALVAMEFDNSGMLLVTADRRGHDFHLFRIQPHPVGASLAAVHHLYVLHRGDTSAKVQNIVFSLDSRWVAVSTLRGTTHVFPVTPYGGAMGVRTHTSLHVVNKLSRFHRSAGLSADGRSSSPISHSESTTFVQSLQPYHNPTLPPFPRPTVVLPLAQLRQPMALGSPPGSAGASVAGKTAAGGGSTQRQRLSSLSDDSGKPLSVCAIFAKSRSWLLDPPNATREAPHRIQRKAVDSIFVMAGHGALIQYDLDTKLAPHVAKEKICDDTPIELDVEAKAQWNLGRRKEGSQELMPPLSSDNWLIRDRNSCMLTDSTRQYDDSDDRTESWLSQVEIITHAGPHRRLWMGPQCVFKTYNTPSGSNLNHVDAEAVEIGVTKSTTTTTTATAARTDISSPLNITAAGRAGAVPVLIESGSYSSIEQSPKLMDRFRHDHMDSDYAVAHGDSRLKEDLADAMRESPSVSVTQKLAGRFLSSHAASSENIPFYDALAEHEQELDDDNDSNATNYDDFADSTADQPYAGDAQTHSGRASSTAVAALASALPNIYSYETAGTSRPSSAAGSGYESLESLKRQKTSIEKVVNPLGTVTTVTAGTTPAMQADILDEVVSQLAAEDCVIHENCDEALFRPVVAIFCDKKKPGSEQQAANDEGSAEREAEEKWLCQPPEAVGNKLIVPVIAKEVDAELCKKEKEKSLSGKAKQKQQQQHQQQQQQQHQHQQQQQQLKQNLQKANKDEEHPKFAEFSSLNKMDCKSASQKSGFSKDSNLMPVFRTREEPKSIAETTSPTTSAIMSKKATRKNSREETQRQIRDVKSPEKLADVVAAEKKVPKQTVVEPDSDKPTASKRSIIEKSKTVTAEQKPLAKITAQIKPAEEKVKKTKSSAATEQATAKKNDDTIGESVLSAQSLETKITIDDDQDNNVTIPKQLSVETKKGNPPPNVATSPTTIPIAETTKDMKIKTELLSSKNLRDSLIEISTDDAPPPPSVVEAVKLKPDKKPKATAEKEKKLSPEPEEMPPTSLKAEPKKKKPKSAKSSSGSEADEVVVEVSTKRSSAATTSSSNSRKSSLEKMVSLSSDDSSYADLADSLLERKSKKAGKISASFAQTAEKSSTSEYEETTTLEPSKGDDVLVKGTKSIEEEPQDRKKDGESVKANKDITEKSVENVQPDNDKFKSSKKLSTESLKSSDEPAVEEELTKDPPKTDSPKSKADKSINNIKTKSPEQLKSPKKSGKQIESTSPTASPGTSPKKSKNEEKSKVICEQPRLRKDPLPADESPTKNSKKDKTEGVIETDETDSKTINLVAEDEDPPKSKSKLSPINRTPIAPALPSVWKSMSGSEMITSALESAKKTEDNNYPTLGKTTPNKAKKPPGSVKLALDDIHKPEMRKTVEDKLVTETAATPIKPVAPHFKEPLGFGKDAKMSSKKAASPQKILDDFPVLEALPPLPDLEPLGELSASPIRSRKNEPNIWRMSDDRNETVSDQISLINFESPLQENPGLERKITPLPRGFTEQNLIFAMCGSLHYENESNILDATAMAAAAAATTPSPTLSIAAGIDFKTLGGEESYHSIEQSSQETTNNTTTKFSSSANSSASEEILIVEERTMTKKQRRKKQQMDLEKLEREKDALVTPPEDEELRPLISAGMSDSQLETYVDTMVSSVDGTSTYHLLGIGQPTLLLDDSFNIKTSNTLQQLGNNSTTTDSEGPMPATTSDDNVVILPSSSGKTTTPHKLKTKKLEHKINLIAAIEAATSSSSTSSAEESGIDGGGRRSPEFDSNTGGVGGGAASLVSVSATPMLSLPHQLPTVVMGFSLNCNSVGNTVDVVDSRNARNSAPIDIKQNDLNTHPQQTQLPAADKTHRAPSKITNSFLYDNHINSIDSARHTGRRNPTTCMGSGVTVVNIEPFEDQLSTSSISSNSHRSLDTMPIGLNDIIDTNLMHFPAGGDSADDDDDDDERDEGVSGSGSGSASGSL